VTIVLYRTIVTASASKIIMLGVGFSEQELWRLLSSEMWCWVDWWKFTYISEGLIASIFRLKWKHVTCELQGRPASETGILLAGLQPWRCRHCVAWKLLWDLTL
jgi:hypothetical protein